MTIVPCNKGAQCNWPACPLTCVGRPGYEAIPDWSVARAMSDRALKDAIAAADHFKRVSDSLRLRSYHGRRNYE